MEALDLLKEAVKSKSWPMVRLALKEFEEKQVTYGDLFPVKPNFPPDVLVTQREVQKERPFDGKPTKNLFHDDGTNASIDGVVIGSFEEDKKLKGPPSPRIRQPYKEKQLECSVCHRVTEVDPSIFSYWRLVEKEEGKSEYRCNSCVSR